MRVLIVQNTRSGVDDAGIYDFVRALGAQGTEVVMRFLTPGESVGRLLPDAETFDRVVAAGGDGTVSSVAYALRESRVPLVIYPGGSANLVAMNLRMPTDPAESASVVLQGSEVQVDMGELIHPESEPVGFLMGAGAGFDAAIMEGARELKAALGAGAYIVSALQSLTPTVSRFELELDGETVKTEGIAVLLANFARIQFDLSLSHHADAQDGFFEVIVLRTKSVVGLIPAIWAALVDRLAGDHPDRSPSLEIHTASCVRISADPQLPVQYDGEVLQGSTPIEARVLPGAATLLVPPSRVQDGRLLTD